MMNNTPKITIFRTAEATTYEHKESGIVIASVGRCADRWHSYCFYGPEEYDEEVWTLRSTAESVAQSYALSMADAL
jgi:hypothetical protein